MDCEWARILITAFLDDELNSDQTACLLEHLKICPDCRNVLEREKILKERIKFSLVKKIAPIHLELRIIKALQNEYQKRRRRNLYFIITISPLIVALFLLAILYLYQYKLPTATPRGIDHLMSIFTDFNSDKAPLELNSSDQIKIKNWIKAYKPSFYEKLFKKIDRIDLCGVGGCAYSCHEALLLCCDEKGERIAFFIRKAIPVDISNKKSVKGYNGCLYFYRQNANNFLTYEDEEFRYVAISKLPQNELVGFILKLIDGSPKEM